MNLLDTNSLIVYYVVYLVTFYYCTGNCDEPQSPANGGKNSTGNTEGQMVNYFCNPGFKLSGDKNRTCQADGQWSGTQPLCIRKLIGLV